MGCDAFLGEDIEAIKRPTVIDPNALTIEVDEAVSSDLIFLFLESFGTTAELTAFALDKDIVDKVIVFNDINHKNPSKPSFLTIGPLRLIHKRNPRNIFYYSPNLFKNGLSPEVTAFMDAMVSRVWFKKCVEAGKIDRSWAYESFIALCAIYSFFPVSTDDLVHLLDKRFTADEILSGVKELMDRGVIPRKFKKTVLIPDVPIGALNLDTGFQQEIGNCRSRYLYQRLNDLDFVDNYRILFNREK